ncbi:glycosyltransferase family 4 protein [Musicola paradisiaca]|uniref:Glycosyl transferase group 1 n=1 Tax=Musicola paradisiaca (strain Ech703) TaxID=579405 RepID=C6CDG6_MUSP7|nr:glycosyltransferase family 1 protein [Musicola paradisiaca]ACS87037.1 glycosyl transferase group 1 [Musicola paradisiaca Ech703]
MKVILSVEPIRFPLTGIGRYTWELASALMQASQLSDLKFFSGRQFLRELPQVNECSDIQYGLKQWVQKSYLATEIYRLLVPLLKKAALKNHDDYLYHGPNFFLPPFPGKKIATFHDLSPFTWAQCNTPQRNRFRQKEILKTLASADALITDSMYTRQEVANYFNWPIERIYSVPLACSPDFHQRDPEECREILSQYQLTYQHYSLYVGTIEPRKNLVALLDAYSRLPLDCRRRIPLILTGYQGWHNESIMLRLETAQREGWARYLGYLPAKALPILFSGARVFCFPSLYEGFGLPVLEAIASGVPVVCSDSSSLPEVVGEAGLMCKPDDIECMTALLIQAIDDGVWRGAAISKGLQRASEFSWQQCAEQTIEVYQKVINN